MNDRQKELLRTLLVQNGQTLHIGDLSEQLRCAEKTVRNDLNVIEELLAEYPTAYLSRQPGIGITLDIEETGRSELFQKLLSTEPKTPQDRFIEIAYHLLVSNKAITLQELSKKYYVPKATIKKDLDSIARWYETYQLELISKPRLGNVVQGSELRKRSALAHLSELLSSVSDTKNYVLELFQPYEITAVKKALNELQQKNSIAFTDAAIESLLVHSLIMMKRTRQKSPVTVPDKEKEAAYSSKEYSYAIPFFEQLESAFQIKFSEDERIYFTWHLISGKRKNDAIEDPFIKNDYLLNVITDLITKLSTMTLFPFKDDLILKNGLIVHVHSVINRIKYGFPITNPLLPNIKKMYPYLFNMVLLALNEVKENHELEVPEDEAAYLVLHFQASIERLKEKREKQRRTLIVCHMGVGMSHLLQAKIEQHYKDMQVVGCIGQAELSEYLKKSTVDFIISTVELKQVSIPHLTISPLLEAKDKEKLNQFLTEMEKKQIISNEKKVLTQLSRGDLVHIHVDKEHPFQVIEMLGNKLYEKGFVTKEFIHSALLRERKSSTSIGGLIAIPHGSPTMVNQSAVAIALLKEPINWGNEQVSLVFMLAISTLDPKLNRKAVGQIVAYSETPSFIHSLIESSSVKEFLEKLK